MTGHVIGFARYWNRPMGSSRGDFLFQLGFLAVLSLQGKYYCLFGAFFFFSLTGAWTWETFKRYRRGERAGRHRHYDRNDIWKDGLHG